MALFISAPVALFAQSGDEAENARIVESKNYVFKAQSVTPQRGATRHLTSEYDLAVAVDTVISFLPYFGRAFSAPLNPGEGGIKFTSADFEYKASKKTKKKRWDITIIPKDAGQAYRLNLTIFTNGYASLQVNSNNRQPISFYGYIVAGKPKDKKAF